MFRSHWKPGKQEVVAENGVVTAMTSPSAEAGLEILKKGGNAVDAAVAIGFCNVVIEPYMATIGGMGYMLVHMASDRRTYAIDFNGRAPQLAHPDMYRVTGPAPAGDFHVFEVNDHANREGPLAATVPATCAGLCEAHRLFGVLPLEQVLEPAIHLASAGFETNWHLSLFIANHFDAFSRDPYFASMWLPSGRVPISHPKPGQRIIQRDLADLLKRISTIGPDAMYRGEVAAAIDEFMRAKGGLIRMQDLAEYKPVVSEPLVCSFMGHEVKAVPTPSGAVTNLQALSLLNTFDLGSLEHNSAKYLDVFIQIARHTFADRFRYLGDWAVSPVPLTGLLSPDYADEIAGQIRSRSVDFRANLEEPWIYYMDRSLHDPWLHDPSNASPTYEPAVDTNTEDTTHINVVDRHRNAVSCTHTGEFAAGLNLRSTGVYLVGGMAWFIPKPGYANSISGWKRPLNNMAPIMVFREGKPILCQGAPGARRIMNRGVQVVANVLAFGMDPQTAIEQPTVDASGNTTLVDSRLNETTVQKLIDMGHSITVVEEEPGMGGNFSRPTAIYIDYTTGLLRAGVDPFRPATALGY